MPRAARSDERRKRLCEQARPHDSGDSCDAGQGALKRPLLRAADALCHQSHGRRSVESPQRHDRDAHHEDRSCRRQAVDRETDRPESQAREERAPFAEALHDAADEHGLRERKAAADHRQGVADVDARPAVAIVAVQHEHALQRLVREVVEQVDGSETRQLCVRPQERQRAHWIGPLPREGAPMIRRQGLRQHEQAVHRVGQTEPRGDPERRAWTERAEHAAECGAKDEAAAKGRAHQTVCLGALFWSRHISDVRESRRHTR
jgi:hypothetical protein